MRWQTPTRYYLAIVQQDLLGDWQVYRTWGARGSGEGGSLAELAGDELDAQRRLESVARTRLRRGYRPLEEPAATAGPTTLQR